MGVQMYARRGVQLPLIQFLGRWGSAAVERYVGEALADRAAWAPLAAAADFNAAVLLGNGGSGAGALDTGAIAAWVRECVLREIIEANGGRKAGRRASAGGQR